MIKNSKRIQSLVKLSSVVQNCEIVWDLCCDHGHIGISVQDETHCNSRLNLVDQIPSITNKLSQVTKERSNGNTQVLCNSATAVDYKNEHANLFIIAGVGGELSVKILSRILETNLNTSNSFIVSPHNNVDIVRSYLLTSGLKLHKEILVKDNNKFYEMLLLDFKSLHNVSPYGSMIWESMSADKREYINIQLKYLDKKMKYSSSEELKTKYNTLKKNL